MIPFSCSILNNRLKRFNPRVWLPLLTFAWGVSSICQGLVTNQAGLFGIRVCEFYSYHRFDTSADDTCHSAWVCRVRIVGGLHLSLYILTNVTQLSGRDLLVLSILLPVMLVPTNIFLRLNIEIGEIVTGVWLFSSVVPLWLVRLEAF